MKYVPIITSALVAAFVAGCGGGSSITQEQYDAAQQRAENAEKAKEQAEKQAKEQAEAARREEERLANEARQAEDRRRQEQEAREEAERKAAELEEEAGHTASQLVQANARRVFEGLVEFQADTDANDNTGGIVGNGDPTVTPRHRESASVITDPAVTFSSITPVSRGKWYRTSFSHRGGTFTDRLDVYSDAESPDHVPFRDSVYNDGVVANEVPNTGALPLARLYGGEEGTTPNTVIDSEGDVVGSLDLMNDNVASAVASSFPRSGDPAKSFTLTDRGMFTKTQIDAGRAWYVAQNDGDEETVPTLPDHCSTACDSSGFDADYTGARTVRNDDRFPLRYTYEVGGSLSGASGTYTCASPAPATSCRVTNQSNHFRFVGPWVFTPSASARVRVDDAEFMYFGWWARQANADESWDYRTFHGPTGTETGGNRSTGDEMSQLTGSAEYVGPAVGYFSFYQPLTSQSEYGEFSATATLRANFDNDMVDGTIDQFHQHPDWTLTLKHGATTSTSGAATTGQATNGVSWQIDGEAVAAPDAGSWEAAFYSNLSSAERQRTSGQEEDAVPTGIAGTFEAKYHNVGAIIGAFGAHKQP